MLHTDNIIFLLCIQIFAFAVIDYLDYHGFPAEALVITIHGILILWMNDKKDKK